MIFVDGQSNGVIQFYPGPSLITIATKFGTKLTITRHAQFYATSSKGGFSAIGRNIRKKMYL